jgi:tRNA (adenine37-N6)-methyltransferase
MEFIINSIGKIVKSATGNHLELDVKYRDGLLELENYSHMHVYWWASELDMDDHRSVLRTEIPYSKDKISAGVFACRSPERPNLIMESICKIVGINAQKGRIFIENIDAFKDTPLIDIKPYIHCNDRVKECKVPKWFPKEWGEWLPKGGIN